MFIFVNCARGRLPGALAGEERGRLELYCLRFEMEMKLCFSGKNEKGYSDILIKL